MAQVAVSGHMRAKEKEKAHSMRAKRNENWVKERKSEENVINIARGWVFK